MSKFLTTTVFGSEKSNPFRSRNGVSEVIPFDSFSSSSVDPASESSKNHLKKTHPTLNISITYQRKKELQQSLPNPKGQDMILHLTFLFDKILKDQGLQ